jgi:quinol-cytochrome oxidoreductase complex cytochrome b subunit
MARGLLFFIPLYALFNMTFIQGFTDLNTNILLVGSCIMILLCCLYFVDLFRRDEEIMLLREPLFWVTTGLLVFNMGELSYNLFLDYILKNRHDAKALLFISIISLLIYVLYTFISIGLLCIKKPFRRM